MSPFVEDQLSNGLRIVIEVMPHVKSAACGFLVRTGARDEVAELAGVSHFLEHMCFKGTPRRTWREINIEFDEMGSYYNAFTSKDRTFYHGWVRSGDVERQTALLADLMQSALPPDEFDMEKNVILEEIAMSSDQLEQLAYHLLHEKVFSGAPMAWPVLGYEETVRNLTRDRMYEYFARRYAPDNMIFIAAGNIDPSQTIRAVKRLCGEWAPSGARASNGRKPPAFHVGTAVQKVERFNQQAILLAFAAASARDEQEEESAALSSILGGENSRFYWNIVQTGIAPRASVWHEDYEDCGLMILYGIGNPANAEKLAEAMQREALAIATQGVTEPEVQRVRNKRRTHLAAEAEAPYYRLGQIMEDVDYRGHPRTVEERLDRVNQVTAESIAAYLKRFPITDNGYFVSVGPRDWPPV
jgi:predicted Zn-dependent peptidase